MMQTKQCFTIGATKMKIFQSMNVLASSSERSFLLQNVPRFLLQTVILSQFPNLSSIYTTSFDQRS